MGLVDVLKEVLDETVGNVAFGDTAPITGWLSDFAV